MIRVAWGWTAALAVLVAAYDIGIFRGLPQALPQSYNIARVIHSLFFPMRYEFASFSLSTASFLRAAIYLVAPGHYQPRRARGVCISKWGLRAFVEWEGSDEDPSTIA